MRAFFAVKKIHESDEKFPQERLLIQSARIGLYLMILLLALMSQLLQEGFLNWSLLRVFYGVIFVGLLVHAMPLLFLQKFFSRQAWVFATFVLDAVLISTLAIQSDLNQSLFLFMYLLEIILCGLVLRLHGALVLALMCSIGFTLTSIFGPEMKSMSFLFLLVLNNIAFFVVAWLSGFLSEQLNILGQKIEAQNLDLRTIQKLNEAIVETIPSGLINTNLGGEILRANLGATRIFLKPLVAGEQILNILPEIAKIPFAEIQTKNPVRPPSFEILFQQDQQGSILDAKAEGEIGEMLLRVTRLTQESSGLNEATYLYIFEDLTQLRRLEEAVRQSEKMAAVGQLAAGIAHEIRNPLAGISGSIELLQETSSNEDDRKLTKIIMREIDRLNNLISEFLDYAKPEKNSQDVVDLGLVFKDVLSLASAQQPAGLELRVQLSSHDKIRGSSDKIKQALLNIVINAYQAMAEVSHPVFSVTTERQGDQLVLRLRDTGGGMSETVKKRIFEPFMTTKAKGTGLGLAITHKILETHGAKVVVESAVGRGTEFIISFPSSPGG